MPSRDTAVQAVGKLLSVAVMHTAILVLPLYFVWFKGGSYRSMGFTGYRWFSNVVHGLFVYLAVLPLFCLAVIIWALLLELLGVELGDSDMIQMFKGFDQAWMKWLLIAIVSVFGPITEEVFFRGFVYPAMRRRMRPAGAILLNGAVFGLIHLDVVSFLPIMLLGSAMAFLFEKTKSIVSCSIFHIAHNSLQMVLLFRVLMGD